MELNQIYNENCLDTMSRMPENFVDLVVTSPPYDNLRDYNGYSFPFEEIAKQLFRVIKDGGILVWIVGDETINGSETGTSFRQVLFFNTLGFNIHDTMIYEKNSSSFPANDKSNRYSQIFEYMFVLSKGKPKTTNLLIDKKNNWAGTSNFGKKTDRNKNGELETKKGFVVKEFSPRNNIWKYNTGHLNSTKDEIAFFHPAIFPEKLAEDHILSWSNENDLIYDPFGGSGTTGKMANKWNRNYILSEISSNYSAIAEKRINDYKSQLKLF